MKIHTLLTGFLLIILVTAGCISVPAEDERPQILVTVPPMVEMVSAVCGDNFSVVSIVPAGVSPHAYEPSPADIAGISTADLWFTLADGLLPLEDRMRASLPDIPVIQTGSGVLVVAEAGGADGEPDPHIWISAQNGIQMVCAIRDGLVASYPEYADAFTENADVYLGKISDADTALRAAAESMNPKAFLTTHGSFGYLAKDYAISQLVITREGKEPTARTLAAIIDTAQESGVHLIITEPSSVSRAAAVLAEELGVSPLSIDTLSPRYLDTLRKVAEVVSQ